MTGPDETGLNEAERYMQAGYGDEWAERTYKPDAVLAGYWSGLRVTRNRMRATALKVGGLMLVLGFLAGFLAHAGWGS
jgi:hypothetical protein